MSSTETTPRTTSQPVSSYQTPQKLDPANDLLHYVKSYAREKPDMAALWCFGIGFVIGWKLKPW